MARLYTEGFELRDVSGTGVTLETTIVRSGTASAKCDSGVGNVAASLFSGSVLAAPNTTATYNVWGKCAFFFADLPTSAAPILTVFLPSSVTPGQYSGAAVLNTDGSLVGHAELTEGTASSTKLTTGKWYVVEISVTVAITASTSRATTVNSIRVDGVDSGAGSATQTTTTSTPNGNFNLKVGWGDVPGASVVCYVDDRSMNDSTGSAQTSWCGLGKIVLLVPTADSAKGTGWTNDAASSTSLFPSVDNTPPVGIADTTTGSGLHQIRNATANANSNYDATMTTYTAAGIASVDTINLVDPLVYTGAPVSTGAKAGTVGVVSNPAIANVALAAAGTSGAFWSGTAAGTHPTGWKLSHGTVTYAPTVTVGTAPVMRITQVTSSTRIAMVDFMGIYVDYTPAAAPTTHGPAHRTPVAATQTLSSGAVYL